MLSKILSVVLALVIFTTGSSYAVARWYIARHAHEPLLIGTTFIPSYARYYDLDPETTLHAIISDLGIRHFRLVSYWDEIEKSPGQYDFTELDWQFKQIEQVNGTVSLSIGLRQPRWPECHMPSWAHGDTKDQWYPKLTAFMQKVMERYKTSPALRSYQLENEYFMSVFGECTDFSRDRLIDEAALVRRIDPDHKLIISRSNNWGGVPVGQPRPDTFAISVYKRVWDKTLTKRYVEYPHPAWFYASLAGWGELLTGKNMIIHELQAEPWPPDIGVKDASIVEQNKSLDAHRLSDRISYGEATGMREIYLWGSEMWYWRKVKQGDSSLWNAVKKSLSNRQCTECAEP